MRFPKVLRPISRIVAALQGVKGALREVSLHLAQLCAAQREAGPAEARLEALELSRHQFEALCEGLLQKAEGKWRAANNAEARERANKKSYEHLLDPFPEDGETPEETARDAALGHDAPASEAERLSAMRLDVAPTNKTLAQRAKFGVK